MTFKTQANEIEFAQLILALEKAGVFNNEQVIDSLCEELRVAPVDLWCIKNRAEKVLEGK
jgi:hypothetical protein